MKFQIPYLPKTNNSNEVNFRKRVFLWKQKNEKLP